MFLDKISSRHRLSLVHLLIAPRMFSFGVVAFLGHRTLIACVPAYPGTVMRYYLGDLLALIVCVPMFAAIWGLFGVRNSGAMISLREILSYWVLFSVYFEVLAPLFWDHMTSDPLDGLAYLIGGLCLWRFQG